MSLDQFVEEAYNRGVEATHFPGRGPETKERQMGESAGGGARWWRGNLHGHSLWSDGDDFPEMVAERYKRLGYQFIAITDHDGLQKGERYVATDARPNLAERLEAYLDRFGDGWVERRRCEGRDEVRLKPLCEYRRLVEEAGRFMVMSGEEVTVTTPEAAHYMNAWNPAEAIVPVEAPEPVSGMLEVVRSVASQREAGGRTVGLHLNHPNWRWCAVAEEVAQVAGLKFMSIFTALQTCNSHGDALRASAERMWDTVLALRLGEPGKPGIYGLATDDAHGYDDPGSAAGRAWVMVRSRFLTPEHIIGAMEAGEFYASTGVTLSDVGFDGRTLSVAIQGEAGFSYRTEFIGTRRGFDRGSEAVLDEEGKPIRTTRRYSEEVGQVLGGSHDLQSSYTMAGDELYVRARVTSDKPHPLPHVPGDTEMAWTQPVAAAG